MENQYYFEFSHHEYYALIAVNITGPPFHEHVPQKAEKLYFEHVAGQSLHQVRMEGFPRRIKEQEALLMFLKSNPSEKVGKLLELFKKAKNEVLIIDNALL